MDHECNRTFIGGAEGFRLYAEKKDEKYLLIIDESTMLSLLSEEDALGLSGQKILEFASVAERSMYLAQMTYLPNPLSNAHDD